MRNNNKVFFVTKKIVKIMLWAISIFLVGCEQNVKKTKRHLYRDYDLFNRKGIYPIDEDMADKLYKKRQPFFELIFHNQKLDSIFAYNIYEREKVMPLKVSFNESISVYEINYPKNSDGAKVYYAFNVNKAIQYFIINDLTCIVTVTGKDFCEGSQGFISPKDTINFTSKLLGNKEIHTNKLAVFDTYQYSNRLNKKFTFLNWLHYKDRKIIKK
ncbi:hypothetical protein ACFGVS_01045 [Mucilaginibacter sp. AW1-7]|uniref:hypothetical protein n=1 Tax=Mucilaginibacter sp. AW1-7 TaxID=3349874 RepID=UPI003F740170